MLLFAVSEEIKSVIWGSLKVTISGVLVITGGWVIRTTDFDPELVLCVVTVAGLWCTNAPTAKPLISPERAKRTIATVAILRVCGFNLLEL